MWQGEQQAEAEGRADPAQARAGRAAARRAHDPAALADAAGRRAAAGARGRRAVRRRARPRALAGARARRRGRREGRGRGRRARGHGRRARRVRARRVPARHAGRRCAARARAGPRRPAGGRARPGRSCRAGRRRRRSSATPNRGVAVGGRRGGCAGAAAAGPHGAAAAALGPAAAELQRRRHEVRDAGAGPPVPVPPFPTTRGPDQHAGARELDAATQRAVLSELNPGSFDPAAPIPPGRGAGRAPRPPRRGTAVDRAARRTPRNRAALQARPDAALIAHLNGVMPRHARRVAAAAAADRELRGPGARRPRRTVDAVFGAPQGRGGAQRRRPPRRDLHRLRGGPATCSTPTTRPTVRASGAPISADVGRVLDGEPRPGGVRHRRRRHHFDPETAGSESADLHARRRSCRRSWPPAKADLELYDLWGFALAPEGAGVGRTVATPTTLDAGLSTARRRRTASPRRPSARRAGAPGRSLVHEYIHTLAHPAWDGATSAGGGVMNEGFCEMFTAEILDAQIAAHPQRRGAAGGGRGQRDDAAADAGDPAHDLHVRRRPTQADRAHAENDPHAASAPQGGAGGVLPGAHRVPRPGAGRHARRAGAAAADQCAVPRGVTHAGAAGRRRAG